MFGEDEEIVIQEKVDGKNFRIQLEFTGFRDINGFMIPTQFGSRNVHYKDEQFDFNTYHKAIEHINRKVFLKETRDKLMSVMHNLTDHMGKNIFGFVIFAEYLSKPREGILYYGQTPSNYLAVFDITVYDIVGNFTMLHPKSQAFNIIPKILDIDTVPLLYSGNGMDKDRLIELSKSFIEEKSYLGEQKREGVVIKNYYYYDDYKRFQTVGTDPILPMVKIVREDFKESLSGSTDMDKSAKGRIKTVKDVVTYIGDKYITKGRVYKSIMRLEEIYGRGTIDITKTGELISEVYKDIMEEESAHINKLLMRLFKMNIKQLAPKIVDIFKGILNES